MTGRDPSATLGAALASRRRRAFVGRASERELFEAALEADSPPLFSVLYMHGPGGIGKSTLLEVFATLAAARGANVVRLDGRSLVPTRSALLEAWPEDVDAPVVVLIDAYERLTSLDSWIRTTLLPPAAGLGADRGGRPDAAIVRLAERPGVAGALAHRVAAQPEPGGMPGVPHRQRGRPDPARHPGGGDPRAPAGAVLAHRSGDARPDPLTPDLVGTLVRRFVDAVPSAQHRRALEVCALARVTTEALLRDTLERDDAGELFDWMRGLSFIETSRRPRAP